LAYVAPDAILVEELFLQVLNLKAGVIKAQLNGKKPPGVLHRLDEACKHLASLGDAKIPAYTGELKLTSEEKPNEYNAETHTSYMTTGIKRLENLRDSCQQALEELRFPGNVKADGALLPFLISCYELRHNQVLHHLLVESGKIPQGAKLHAQLRKFSRYKKGVKDLVSASSFLRQFQKVEYERVPTTAPLQLPPPTNNTIPELLQSLGLQDAELQNKCKKGFQMLRSKPLHVHAEVELIFFYATRGRKPEKFIGCSKLACFLCNMFLGFHPNFQVRGAHRKVCQFS